LRFELASYEALLSKHWDDRPRRAVEPDYEVQLWAAGRIAAADAALTLLETRARRSAEEDDRSQGTSWPEFAESNCLACHQPLRAPAVKSPVVSSGRTPSAIAWQSWNTALVGSVVFGNSLIENERPPQPFGKAAGNLRAAMEQSLEPPPAAIASLAARARAAQLSAVAAAYQNQVLAREASEAKLQRVQNAYDAIKDLPDPATVGTAHRVLIAAAGGCDVPETRAMADGAQTPAAQPVGPSGIERALGDYIAACSADAAQMIPMVELAP